MLQYTVVGRNTMSNYEATCEHKPELSTTGGTSENQICDDCGEPFYAYEIPGRETYLCNHCK